MADLLPGVAIRIGTMDFVVAPLTLGQLRRLAPDLDKIGSGKGLADGEMISAIVKIVGAALRRNYPDLADEAVEEMLDLGNALAALNAVLANSGLARSAAPGEAGAAPGDGTSFTASSPPPSAGASPTSTN